ncbi:kinase-like protein [Lentinus tigrinus ALCF2SS1-7]|uniref:non-specific serine/threonine protein kinase n=1 Tax=Lentinus tigrinus ALCF2SS1-6 TaxID=1328759 RepID=A0A5C2SP54_9APHY|nr:kinase-like protein [Lentinus tigrinus ALCF2SS1-6]RPD79001.1 kinase-like protein [Lentinus tigrinus ALCF2SS1-7]
MLDEPEPSSPAGALVAVGAEQWQPILHVSDQVVLYNPTSHALSIQTHSRSPSPSLARHARCPYCHRSLTPNGGRRRHEEDVLDDDIEDEHIQRVSSRAANYFQLLEIANESSRPSSPTSAGTSSGSSAGPNAFRADNMAEGYFKAFFQEVCRLGMGANGSVFLCQHVLDGNPLGYFAVKKVAVGQSHSYLLNTLREVRLLEKLRHPNIVTFHHAWLESSQFSSFGPRIPTLHILMQWAEGGSLDDLIDARLGRRALKLPHLRTSATTPSGDISVPPSPAASHDPAEDQPYSRNARIRAFRALQRAPPEERERLRHELGLNGNDGPSQGSRKAPGEWKPVHLFSAEEVHDLFQDVVAGLAFLHDKSILHLDLKPGNVLLTWDEGRLVPRAMLSDFGTSQDMLNARTRSGNTGTLEYAAPESLPVPSTGQLLQVDSKADMWSLGMILHKLLFFKLPYRHTSDNDDPSRPKDGKDYSDRLEAEIQDYPGFKSSSVLVNAFESRRLPKAYLLLLESLLHVKPVVRPSSERVLSVIKDGGASSSASALALARPGHVRVSPERSHPPLANPLEESSDASLEEVIDDDADIASNGEEKRPLTGRSSVSSPPSYARKLRRHIHRWHDRIPKPMRLPRHAIVRTVKSSILVAKVVTLSRMCPDGRPNVYVTGAALALAVVDTWFDGLQATLAFGAVHFALLSLACVGNRCCD